MEEDFKMEEMPLCPEFPPNLTGPFIVEVRNISIMDVMAVNSHLQEGGRGKPKYCKAKQKIAIIIPFRNREPHLKIWLHYMLPFLQKQQGDFGIYVVEQIQNTTFNRAKLMNVGYSEAIKDYDYNCFIFSDVDIIPMDDRNLYRCSKNPKHMANSLDKFAFKLPYDTIFGGIVAFTKEQFIKVNGFSNQFWGWGGEDDELYNRVVAAGMKIERPDPNISRATAILHNRDPGNEETGKSTIYWQIWVIHPMHTKHTRKDFISITPIISNRVIIIPTVVCLQLFHRSFFIVHLYSFHLINKAAEFMHVDGLNSLDYDVIKHIRHKLYTKITVNVGSEK